MNNNINNRIKRDNTERRSKIGSPVEIIEEKNEDEFENEDYDLVMSPSDTDSIGIGRLHHQLHVLQPLVELSQRFVHCGLPLAL